MIGNRNKNTLLLGTLLILVLGLSIGFAAYQAVLKVDSTAQITPDSSSFKIYLSSNPTKLERDTIKPTVNGNNSSAIIYDEALIDDNQLIISDLTATFTEPSQSITYTFYVRNEGSFDAYLNNISFENIEDESVFKKCVGSDGVSQTLLEGACNAISVTVNVENSYDNTSDLKASEIATLTTSVKDHILPKKGTLNGNNTLIDYETVIVTITYPSDAKRVDGNFEVDFGDIQLYYSSAENTSGGSDMDIPGGDNNTQH